MDIYKHALSKTLVTGILITGVDMIGAIKHLKVLQRLCEVSSRSNTEDLLRAQKNYYQVMIIHPVQRIS